MTTPELFNNGLGGTIPNFLTFKFPFKAVSFQGQRYGNGHVYKSQNQKDFCLLVNQILMVNRLSIKTFMKNFNPEIHVIQGEWFFLYKTFFTKDDNINSKVPDLENGKKMIQDLIFKELGIDDRFVCGSHDYRWKSNQDAIIFRLNILERDYFDNFFEINLWRYCNPTHLSL